MARLRVGALLSDALLLAGALALTSVFGVALVAGGSMEPALRRGDVVVFRRGSQRIASGTLVMLGTGRRQYVHRVVGVRPSGSLVTRGDANPIPDLEETSTAAVRGTVVAIVPLSRLAARLVSPDGSARLWSQSHMEAMTETASAKASRPTGRASRLKGPGRRRGRFTPSAAT